MPHPTLVEFPNAPRHTDLAARLDRVGSVILLLAVIATLVALAGRAGTSTDRAKTASSAAGASAAADDRPLLLPDR